MKNKHRFLLLTAFGICTLTHGFGQAAPAKPPATMVAGIPVNYDEDKVGTYTLPDVLTLKNGKQVTDKQTWLNKRRPELISLFEENQFGKMPPRPHSLGFRVFDRNTPVFGGTAIRRQVTVYFASDTSDHKMDLLIYLPVNLSKPVPLLLMISFSPNSSMSPDDPGVKKGFMWTKDGKKVPAPKTGLGKLDVQKFTSEGYAVATVYYGDIEPDNKIGYQHGIRGLYMKPGETYPADNEWGAISAWAWGLSRAMDYFETDRQIDANRIALQGTSRLGKTVLWAAAHDTRFKMVIPSCSGEGGAALSRRNYGETIKHLSDTSRYYYQFAPNWHNYSDDPDQSPVDAHMLVSLIAPRYVLLQTGDTDYWSGPKGEFEAAVAAEPVFKLFGESGPGTDQMPAAGDAALVYKPLGYYMHKGGHGTVPSDWDIFLNYIKTYL